MVSGITVLQEQYLCTGGIIMENDIYKEEYIREQARIAAQRDKPKPNNKNQLLRYTAPALFIGILAYTVIIISDAIGFSPLVFLELDFIVAALVLTALFLWARNS